MPDFDLSFPNNPTLNFDSQRILIVGDLMLDRYTFGRATRISPEAPVPVLEFEKQEDRLGGAANVALNLQALGATPILAGLVGNDADGDLLIQALMQHGIEHQYILKSKERVTTVKTRIMAGRQQLARLDREQTHDLTVLERALFLNTTAKILQEAKVTGLVFQDYNKGVLTKEVIETVSSAAHSLGIPIFVDPKLHNFWSYRGAALFKPNLKEVREAIGTPVEPSLFSLREAAKLIRSKTSAKNILITLSEHGLFLDNGDFSEIVSTRARVVADPCGAGDTVISMAALAICQGFSPMDVAQLANLAGGQVVEKSGVVAINKQQLLDEFFHNKNQV